MTLHLTPGEIESRLIDNVAMYENARWPNGTTRNLANHWQECLHRFHDYQEGRITLAELPLAVKEMGWIMPDWGTHGT